MRDSFESSSFDLRSLTHFLISDLRKFQFGMKDQLRRTVEYEIIISFVNKGIKVQSCHPRIKNFERGWTKILGGSGENQGGMIR